MNKPTDDAALIAALRDQQQADENGKMVLVSRQACDEAAAVIAEQQSRIAELERERNDAVKRMEAGWIQVCAEPAIKHFKEAAEQAERELARARADVQTEMLHCQGLRKDLDETTQDLLAASDRAEANAKDAERYQTVKKMTMTALNEAHRQASMRDGVRFDDSIDAVRRRIAAASAASAKETKA